MSFKIKFSFLSLLFIISSFSIITSKINIKANSVESFCTNNNFYFQLNVQYSSKPTNYIPFTLEVIYPETLLFRCLISPNTDKIFCYANFENNDLVIKEGNGIELPYPFPEIEDIEWDYDSFLNLVYRRVWKLEDTCGDAELGYELSNLAINNWGFISNVKILNKRECNINSENNMKFNFKMSLNVIGGTLKKELSDNGEDFYIKILHSIIVPFELGKKRKDSFNFKTDKYYHAANCYLENNEINLKSLNDLVFNCDVPLTNKKLFSGPLRIESFYDHLYVEINSKSKGTKEIKFIKMYFNTLQDQVLPTANTNAQENDKDIILLNKNKRYLDVDENEKKETTKKKKKDDDDDDDEKKYIILDNELSVYHCPDKPIFKIIGSNMGGIQYQTNVNNTNKFDIFLVGTLDYGIKNLKLDEDELENMYRNINFKLTIDDNFVKDTKNKQRIINCKFNDDVDTPTESDEELYVVQCEGTKLDTKNANVDFSINHKLSENRFYKNLIIEWPKDIETNTKQIYSYKIQALAMKNGDFGCFENKFYFYIYIYDLNYEPQVRFNIQLSRPKSYEATCELYNSYTLKCYIDLTLKKISIGTKILLSNDTTSVIATREGNEVFFDTSKVQPINRYIYSEENCGDFVVVGALKNAGFSYWEVIGIIIGCIGFVVIVGIIVCYIVLYHIISKNRKGQYYAHKEELDKTVGIKGNNSTNQNPLPPNK